MTATESIITSKLESVNQALRQEEEKVKELKAVERVLAEVLEGEGVKPAELVTTSASAHATLKELVRSTLENAGRPVSIAEIEAAVRTTKGAATRKQGIYSTCHEMVKHHEAKRVRPGVYKALKAMAH